MKINYQDRMQRIIDTLDGMKPSLLLHVCCAPCTSSVLERLFDNFDVTCFFDNPNITSFLEYEKRERELHTFLSKVHEYNAIEVVTTPFNPRMFYKAVKGFEREREGGARCTECFTLRLQNTATYAKANQFDFFTTTLSVSPHKSADTLNQLGYMFQEKMDVSFLPSDFKKKNGYLRSIELCREYGIYRQNYCGCSFSEMERIASQPSQLLSQPNQPSL